MLYVGRLTPENLVDLLVRAYGKVKGDWPCVVVGPAGYEVEYGIKLHRLAGPRVKLVGPVYGKGYEELSANCGILFCLEWWRRRGWCCWIRWDLEVRSSITTVLQRGK